MADVYDAGEILAIAERIEENGVRYYERAAEIVLDPKAQEMLLSLADMEREHARTFAAMRREHAEREAPPSAAAPDSDAVKYLRSIADGFLFQPSEDPAEALDERIAVREVLRRAITAEKESIALYVGLREAVASDADRHRVERIIREEMGHAAMLSDWLASQGD